MNKNIIIALVAGVVVLAGVAYYATQPSENGNFITQTVPPTSKNCFTKDVPYDQCLILLDIYGSTNGANWKNTQKGEKPWFGTDKACDFFGVKCSGGKIITLALSANQLSGTIPSSLGNLTDLQGLFLDQNKLAGTIPSSLGNLAQLKHLDLNRNQLSGPIPSSLGNLTKLIWLQLNNNQLKGPIPSSIGNLKTLGMLNISYNQLCGLLPNSFMKTWPYLIPSQWGFNNNNLLTDGYDLEMSKWLKKVYFNFGVQKSEKCPSDVITNGGTGKTTVPDAPIGGGTTTTPTGTTPGQTTVPDALVKGTTALPTGQTQGPNIKNP